VVGVKGASGRELLCHKPIKSTAELSLDSTKVGNDLIIIYKLFSVN